MGVVWFMQRWLTQISSMWQLNHHERLTHQIKAIVPLIKNKKTSVRLKKLTELASFTLKANARSTIKIYLSKNNNRFLLEDSISLWYVWLHSLFMYFIDNDDKFCQWLLRYNTHIMMRTCTKKSSKYINQTNVFVF